LRRRIARLYNVAMKLCRLLFAFATLCAARAFAEDAVSFQIAKPAEAVRLGSAFRIEVETSYPENFTLHPDPSTANSQTLKTTAIKPGKAEKRGGAVYQKFTFDVIPFDLGIATFPAVSWSLSGNGQLSSQRSPELPVEVLSYANNVKDPDKLRDIRPPWKPFNWLWLLLLLLPAGYYLWRRLRRRAQAESKAGPPPDNRPPEVIAYEELDRLLMDSLWEEGRHKQFYETLANILRDYLERRTGVAARNYNTADLYRRLSKIDAARPAAPAIRKFFIDCDFVKFAKYKPQAHEKNGDVELIRAIIQQTTPPPPVQTMEKEAAR